MICLLFTAMTMSALPPDPGAAGTARETALAPAARPGNPSAATVRLSVRPMPAPRPALKYQLLPELRELNPGNAAYDYLKCFMEQRRFFYSKEAVADRSRYLAMPLSELPLDKLRDYGGFALRQADWAARLDTVDWQSLQHIREGGMEQLPPEVGPLQVLAAALQVRFRAEVAGKHFDSAIRTAKTVFALSRHLGEHPSEVANVLGLWVAHLGLNTLTEMVQQPGCPNLYWALTDLPCPLVDLRKGVQGERTLLAAELEVLREDAAMTEADLEEFVSRLSAVMNFAREQGGRSLRNLQPALQRRVKDAASVSAARRRLIGAGCAEPLVKKFPPLQVILLDDKRSYEVERDERLKLLSLPLWQIDGRTGFQPGRTSADSLETYLASDAGLFSDLLPHISKLRRTQAELERQIALLRHVEALRLCAAQNGGKLPARLCDMTAPVPADPVTGRPFAYAVDVATAHLRADSLPEQGESISSDVHYEVTILK